MDTSDVIAIAALAAGLTGLFFTWRGDRRSKRAEARADGAETRAKAAELRAIKAVEDAERQERKSLWGNVVIALNEMVTQNALSAEIQGLLTKLRISLTELVDGISEEDYPNISEYTGLAHGITALHYEASLAQLSGKEHTSENVWRAHKPVIDWLSACIQNFRLLRNSEPSPELREQLSTSLQNYREVYEKMASRSELSNELKDDK